MEGYIKKDIVSVGSLAGSPCWNVNFLVPGKIPNNDQEILTTILNSKIKYVMIRGNLSIHPELKAFIHGLSVKGKTAIFVTDSSEDVGPIRMARNVRLIVLADNPDAHQNTIHPSLFSMLKETDEVDFQVDTLEKYNAVKAWLKGRTVTQPTIMFDVSIAKDNDRKEILDQYLADSGTLTYESKLVQFLNIE